MTRPIPSGVSIAMKLTLPLAAILFGATVPASAAEPNGAATPRPNIVLIVADDLGWTDLGCQGSRFYETPHVDRLAARGMRFTDAYACGPVCAPTRAALMSGQYGPRTGVYSVPIAARVDTSRRPLIPVPNVNELPLDRVCIAAALKAAGYATGIFGKWHLGQQGAFHPSQRGFDDAIVTMDKYFNFVTQPKVDHPPDAYLTDWLTDQALRFLDDHRDGPFFLYLPHFAVHLPFQAKAEWIAHFQKKPGVDGHHHAVYAAMIASLDESVGRVMAKLESLGIAERTLVIFTSDNGGYGGYREAGLATTMGITSNAPLRAGKGTLYEGGIRVPWIAAWPGRIPAGTTCREPICSVDLYPTLLALAAAPSPTGLALDGMDLAPLLFSNGPCPFPRQALFWHFPGYSGPGEGQWLTTPAGAVRAGDWKLHEFFEYGRLELYNLSTDIGERTNLAEARPAKRDELVALLRAWRTSVAAPMPRRREHERTLP